VAGRVCDGDVIDAIGEMLVLVPLGAAVEGDVALVFVVVLVYGTTIQSRCPDGAGEGIGGRSSVAPDR
jgi:hypothetical protein